MTFDSLLNTHKLHKDLLPFPCSSLGFVKHRNTKKGIQGQAEKIKNLITIDMWADRFKDADHYNIASQIEEAEIFYFTL